MARTATPMTRRDRTLALVLVLGAFALRVGDLAGQSLWSDEDITLDRTALALGELWRDLPVEHGIGYFALMRGWTRLAGDSDTALRFPSVLSGVVLVALVLALGQRLAGRRAAWFAACAAALSPFLVSYSQEARMYALLAVLATGALAAAERARPGRWAMWAAVGAFAALAIHTHVFGGLLLAILGVLAAGDLAGRWPPPRLATAGSPGRGALARGWLLAAATAAALLLPVGPRLAALAGAGDSLVEREWLIVDGGAEVAPWASPLVALGRTVGAWTAQTVVTATRPLQPAELLAAVFVALAAVAGAIALARAAARRDDRARRAALALAWLIVPLLACSALGAIGVTLHPRYLILGAPGLLVAAGAGIGKLPRRAAFVTGAAVMAIAALPLAGWFGEPGVRKRDYRGLVAHIDATTRGRDTILMLDGPSMGLTKRYLPDESPLKLENLRSETNSNRDRPGFEARLAALVQRRPNVWLATDGAAATGAREWVAGHLFAMGATGLQDVTLRRYAAADASVLDIQPLESIGCLVPEPFGWTTADGTTFGSRSPTSVLCLRGGAAAPDPVSAGTVVRVWLQWLPGRRWSSTAAAGHELRVSVRLKDAAGEVVASLDGRPVDWTRPTTGWQSSDAIDDRYALAVPVDAPPGRYAIDVTLYDEATLDPLVPLVSLPEAITIEAPSAGP